MGTLLTMTENSGSAPAKRAQSSNPSKADKANTEAVTGDYEPADKRHAREQQDAAEAQAKIAQRHPGDVPDVGQVMGDDGARQLNHRERGEQDPELWERAALTPAEKIEKGLVDPHTHAPISK